MRNVTVSNFVSLDGFFAGPGGEIDWFVWDDETAAYMHGLMSSLDTMLFGRVTYELMASYWPTAGPPAEDPIITDFMNKTPKIVFSRTLKKVEWNNSRLVRDNVAGEVSKMKGTSGRDMVIFGSGSIVSAFAQTGLIDDYRIFVNPVVLGEGKTMFRGLKERLKLKLLSTKTFRCGVVLLHYEPERK